MTTNDLDNEVVRLLRQSVGEDKARESLEQAKKVLGFSRTTTREQALAVMEHIAQEPGILGITARFAKSRLLLASTGTPSTCT